MADDDNALAIAYRYLLREVYVLAKSIKFIFFNFWCLMFIGIYVVLLIFHIYLALFQAFAFKTATNTRLVGENYSVLA